MGSGKSSVGHVLARLLQRPFVDNDELLERRTGRTARAVASTSGMDALHDIEAGLLIEVLQSRQPLILAAAASTPLAAAVRDALQQHFVVYLRDDPEALATRVAREAQRGHRPFSGRDPHDVLPEQYAERDACYREIADVVIDAEGRPPEQLAELVSQEVAGRRPRRGSPEP
jgi:shikimate kinase